VGVESVMMLFLERGESKRDGRGGVMKNLLGKDSQSDTEYRITI
jgi:hypothetical protein